MSSLIPTTKSKMLYALIMAFYSIVLSLIFASVMNQVGFLGDKSNIATAQTYPTLVGKIVLVVFAMILAPVLESFLVSLIAGASSYFIKNIFVICTFSAFLWSVLHAFSVQFAVGFIILPFFWLNTYAYLQWRETSYWSAYFVIFLMHFIQNTAATMAGLL